MVVVPEVNVTESTSAIEVESVVESVWARVPERLLP
jgi:hypothetical protein